MSYVKFQINLKFFKTNKDMSDKELKCQLSGIIKTCAESLIFLKMVTIGRKNIRGHYLSNILPPKMHPLTKDCHLDLNTYYVKTYIRD